MATPNDTRSRRTRAAMLKRMLIDGVNLSEEKVRYSTLFRKEEKCLIDIENRNEKVDKASIYTYFPAVRLTA